MANQVSAPMAYTPAQLQAMPSKQRREILAQMNPATRQKAMTAGVVQQIGVDNIRFMEHSIPHIVVCPTDSNALSNTYASGQTLNWIMPQQPNGFVTDLYFNVVLNPTYVANGTSPYFDKNASWPYSFFSRVQVLLNNTQIDVPFYILPYLHNLHGMDKQNMGFVDADYTDSNVQSQIWSDAMPTGQLKFTVHIPLCRIHDYAPAGALPISGVTRPIVKLTCAPSINGVDPAQDVATTNATTWSVAGTVTLKAKFLDGLNFSNTQDLGLDLSIEPTVQMKQDATVQPIVGGLVNRVGLQIREAHYYVIAVVIDGNQSSSFSQWSNIASFGLFRDFNTSNPFFYYGDQDNTSVYDWLSLFRNKFRRDIQTEGVFPLVYAPEEGVANPNNRNGTNLLNMSNTAPRAQTNGSWAAAFFAVKPTTVGSVSGITPRIETYVVSLNAQGLLFY